MMQLGVFGGTFDPPHLGHLILAEAAREQLALDRVLWVLTADPPHKQDQPITPLADRLAMVQAAVAGQPAFVLSRADIDRPGPHFAADTLDVVAREYPGAELIYLIGSDSLRDLPTWGRPGEFVYKCRLGVMRRPEVAVDASALEAALPGVSARIGWIDAPLIEIASRDLRDRVRAGLSIRYLTPERVREIIAAKGLYAPHS